MSKQPKPSTRIYERAKALRHRATGPERKLWSLIRNRQLVGIKFRRQYPLLHYVADFACPELKLIVELDGNSHNGHFQDDQQRQQSIEQLGYHVLRFGNDDVLRDAETVLKAILQACEKLRHQRSLREKDPP